MAITQPAMRMHGILDSENYHVRQRYVETTEQKYFIVQEREVSYRFSAHFHPFVGQLTDRLIRKGTRGLQAADTEYRPNGEALPESVEFTLAPDAEMTVPDGAGVLLAKETTATLQNGTVMTLPRSMHLRTTAAAAARAPKGLRATLVSGMVHTPGPNEAVTLAAQQAFLFGDTIVTLKSKTGVILFNGMTGTVPAGTKVIAARAMEFPIPANTPAVIQKSTPRPLLYANIMDRYNPSPRLVQRPRPVRDLDFTSRGAYAVYNWELFFHAPLTMATHLSKNQRFAEAQRWFHYIFDPTDDSDGPTPERFWKVRPFHTTDVKKVEEILVNLANPTDATLQAETADSISDWQQTPFRPHVIARHRQQAFMYKTVMAYLDNLIAWGDSLFSQDTGETIDEALMLYVLAASILGPRPQAVPAKGTVKPQTYDNLRQDLHKFGTVLRDVEADAPYDLMPLPAQDGATNPQAGSMRSLGKALYFCVPRNDKLMGYWDTVSDRLFKIRNSLNLQGVFRQLALFEPPIDPALLARAAAAGVDISAIVSGLNQPLPLVRFQLLLQKALELAQEVKALGGSLLANMEKEDGEALALLRARHEKAVLELVERVKYAQLQDAIKSKEGLTTSLQNALQRYAYYERQLGKSPDEITHAVPSFVDLKADELEKLKFTADEGAVPIREIDVDIASDATGQPGSGKLLSSHEALEDELLEYGQIATDASNLLSSLGSAASSLPQFSVDMKPWGVGGTISFGGSNVGAGIQATATLARGVADRLNFEARRAARIDGFARREREWAFQSNLAAGEITQIFKQIRAAEIRQAIAEMELANHRTQMKHAAEIEHFLNEEGTNKKGKRTNKALYTWLKREVKGLYAQCFQFAFDAAKKAERALQHELGDTSLTYLQFGYLAGKEGLLAGERLYLDLKRMEMAYLELNRREYELTKHVSLVQLDPQALIQLRETGRCTIRLNEDIFNMDGPSHYFRRIKNVAVTIPCVTGPYASVNCTLTLLKSSIRKTSVPGDRPYAWENSEDDRFANYYGSMQSIVTSSGQNDSGMFDTNLRDERYLPFENSGVISDWQLQLPANPSAGEPTQFDYNTISDVVLHVRYTAREGGEALRKAAVDDLQTKINEAMAIGSVRLLSLRHDFPDAWAAYKAAPKVGDFRAFTMKLAPQHYPYWSTSKTGKVINAALIARATGPVTVAAPDGRNTDALGAFLGDLTRTEITNAPKPPFNGEWSVALTADGVEEAWLLVHWGLED
ncbi:toxin [Nocardia gipuzkoensis]|uniref:Tc toxin subunit A-related protein n=1 Tax=Nocardia gipuzkoensis TaxID=2749991 RepID=UPI00237DD339|nr:toxin [Nocardia gipuzkoensis]MDE1674625.1 toxin [Nocardia gipuzkoensis]